LNFTPANEAHRFLIMDRAYEGDETRALAVELGYIPVVPPKQNRKEPWEYDKTIYKRRNQVERFLKKASDFYFACWWPPRLPAAVIFRSNAANIGSSALHRNDACPA
jgi:transposase